MAAAYASDIPLQNPLYRGVASLVYQPSVDLTCKIVTKLKAPSFHKVNSPLEFPVMQRVTPAGAQAKQNTGQRCLLVDVLTHCKTIQLFAVGQARARQWRMRKELDNKALRMTSNVTSRLVNVSQRCLCRPRCADYKSTCLHRKKMY